MKFSFGDIISGAIVAAIIFLSVLLLPLLPATMATHWGADGMVNGWMSKEYFILFMSGLAVVLWAGLVFLPRIDPLQKNHASFSRAWDYFKISLILFIAYIYALSLRYNMQGPFNLIPYLAPGFALLIYAIGALVSKAKQNWFIGIRTPWTLSSENVWNQTHALGGLLFKLCAIVAALGAFFPAIAIGLMVVPLVGVALFLVVYSYYLFSKEAKSKPFVKKVQKKKAVRKKKK